MPPNRAFRAENPNAETVLLTTCHRAHPESSNSTVAKSASNERIVFKLSCGDAIVEMRGNALNPLSSDEFRHLKGV